MGLRLARQNPRLFFLGLVLLAILLPWLPLGPSTNYILRILTTAVLYMILALGLNIVPGFTGLLDLGYVGFYGIGAYTSGLLAIHYDLSLWVILPLAALNGALWGTLLGAPTLRLTGDYFAIVTFGFSELVVLLLRNELWLTRGPMGLPGISPPSIFGHPLTRDWEFFYLILFLLMIVLLVVTRLQDSRIGRAWFAIREDEIAAQCCGINLIRYKVTAFAISASIGAMGGAFYAKWFKFIHPDMFKFWESILILCLIVFGGMGSIAGTMLGALILIPLSEVLRAVLPQSMFSARYLIYGLVLVLMMRWRPEGLIPFEGAQARKAQLARERLNL
ncbi:MAG: branched-chain amino acid ABC transporter permease [Deltaproteobacteria bacterium]|nr:branched-chain amino acid ABC transporter permease [Deltaproteobacteria bacterium]